MPSRDTGLRRVARWLCSARVRAVLSIGAVLGLGTATAAAQWTDSATATAALSTGSIDLRLGAGLVDGSPVETTTLTFEGMVPGSSVQTPLQVANVGTYPFTYSMSTDASGALAPGLRLSVFANATCTGTPTVVADAALTGAGFSGRPLTGNGGAAPAETLCLRVTLPAGAPGDLQGTTAAATFTFTATTT